MKTTALVLLLMLSYNEHLHIHEEEWKHLTGTIESGTVEIHKEIPIKLLPPKHRYSLDKSTRKHSN